MTVILGRSAKPTRQENPLLIGTYGSTWVFVTQDRVLYLGSRLSSPDEIELHAGLEKACAIIWGGKEWQAGLESVCRMRAGTARNWKRKNTVPPPMVLGWVARISAHSDARAIGYHLRALAESAEASDIAGLAQEAYLGLSP